MNQREGYNDLKITQENFVLKLAQKNERALEYVQAEQ